MTDEAPAGPTPGSRWSLSPWFASLALVVTALVLVVVSLAFIHLNEGVAISNAEVFGLEWLLAAPFAAFLGAVCAVGGRVGLGVARRRGVAPRVSYVVGVAVVAVIGGLAKLALHVEGPYAPLVALVDVFGVVAVAAWVGGRLA